MTVNIKRKASASEFCMRTWERTQHWKARNGLRQKNWGQVASRSVCAAEAIFCCPTENSHHLEALVVSKDGLFHNEKESGRTTARCHVSLEKSSKNYSRCENEPSQATCIAFPLTHPPSQLAGFGGVFSTWWSKTCREKTPKRRLKITPQKLADFGERAGCV